MPFNSLAYALFLPTVFFLYWFVFNKSIKGQNLFIVLVSYLFYGWWDWRFLGLIFLVSFFSWGSGLLIERYRHRGHMAKSIYLLNLFFALGVLGVFKYFNFFMHSLSVLFPGGSSLFPTWKIVLPVGISFYTFQAIGYTVDVYKQKIAPTNDLISFLAFVGFFPQLVAGPIERSTNLLPQFQQKRIFDERSASDGLRLILWGLFKKVVVADTCALYVDSIFNAGQAQPGSAWLMAAILFAYQIYGDFSGYSDIAIGSARLFGIRLMRNFDLPYTSRSIPEFWRRWHISLTTWFRDYVYIPLGGNRGSKMKVFRNTLIVFLTSGLWHGANYTFVAWGAYHAFLFIPTILKGKRPLSTEPITTGRLLPGALEFAKIVLTFLLVTLGWILFRSASMGQAWDIFCQLPGKETLSAAYKLFILPETRKATSWVFCMLLLEWIGKSKECPLLFDRIKTPLVRYGLYAVFVLLIIYSSQPDSTQFIYFQF